MYTKYNKVYSWIKSIQFNYNSTKMSIITEQNNTISTYHWTEEQLDTLRDHEKNNTLCELLVCKRIKDDTLWVRL